jgi:hypothetical protein
MNFHTYSFEKYKQLKLILNVYLCINNCLTPIPLSSIILQKISAIVSW